MVYKYLVSKSRKTKGNLFNTLEQASNEMRKIISKQGTSKRFIYRVRR